MALTLNNLKGWYAIKPKNPKQTLISVWVIFLFYLQVVSFVLVIKINKILITVVVVIGNGHGDTSSNPGRDWLHFT